MGMLPYYIGGLVSGGFTGYEACLMIYVRRLQKRKTEIIIRQLPTWIPAGLVEDVVRDVFRDNKYRGV